jgi:Undecaprenyl-phosphate glucose phosphotransferase
MEHFSREVFDFAKCLTFTFVMLVTLIYLLRRFEFSSLGFLYWEIGFLGLLSMRYSTRRTLMMLRAKGYNQRFALIAGTGVLAQELMEKIESHPDFGIRVIGFLSRRVGEVGKMVKNIPIIGVYEDLDIIVGKNKVDIFFIALPIHEYQYFESLVRKVQGDLTEIKVVPGSYEFMGLRGGMDALGELPMLSLQGSPLHGWDRVFKRAFDLLLGFLILAILSPLLFVISLLVKLTSEGPILYQQERVGFDGRLFQMFKFRTMKKDAEKETGPVWARENDSRRTKVGALLRKISLDELPQLFNVVKGEMSLVGPRPERPNFVKEFRNKIPRYMLRHKIKAGMTGWAQINGWRGNTSLEKRIEHDLYYIQNWSIGLDVKILLMTIWKGFFNKSAG